MDVILEQWIDKEKGGGAGGGMRARWNSEGFGSFRVPLTSSTTTTLTYTRFTEPVLADHLSDDDEGRDPQTKLLISYKAGNKLSKTSSLVFVFLFPFAGMSGSFRDHESFLYVRRLELRS